MHFTYDQKLSWKAKGMLSYLLQNPNLSIPDIIRASKDQRTAVYSGLHELQKGGYMDRFGVRNAFGAFVHFVRLIEPEIMNQHEAARASDAKLEDYYYLVTSTWENSGPRLRFVVPEMVKRQIGPYADLKPGEVPEWSSDFALEEEYDLA